MKKTNVKGTGKLNVAKHFFGSYIILDFYNPGMCSIGKSHKPYFIS